jgi:hypothetical protein
MFQRSIIFVVIVTSIFFSSCVTSYHLKPVIEGDSMELVYIDGKEVAISREIETGVAIYGMKTTQNELLLHILYKNNTTDKNINVIPEQMSVIGYNDRGELISFKVYAADEYLKKMKNAQAWALAIQGVAGAMEASNAGRSTSTTTGSASGRIYGSDGTTYTGYGSSSSTTTTYDYGAQAAANAKNREEIQETAEQYATSSAVVEQGLVKANTLYPEQYVEGDVRVKMNSMYAARFEVTIPIGSETHTITFYPKK